MASMAIPPLRGHPRDPVLAVGPGIHQNRES